MESRNIARFRQQLARMRHIIEVPGRNLASTPVVNSSWSAAAQLDHTMKVANAVLTTLVKEKPTVLPRACSLLGRFVLAIGYIPRGRAKSPEKLAGTAATAAELHAQLTGLEAAIERVAARPGKPSSAPIVPHPIFGGLSWAQGLRLLVVHTEHHLKIIGPL